MKIKYEFTNESIEIEVDEQWGHIVLDLDRQEYNNEHAETRRHCSFEAFSDNGNDVAGDSDVLEAVILNADYANLHKAIDRLEPRQRYLIKEYYFRGRTQTEIAKKEGAKLTAVNNAIKRAEKKLKKFLA